TVGAALESILDVFAAVSSHIKYSAQPDNLICVMLMEQACALLETDPEWSWSYQSIYSYTVAKNIIGLFQKIVRQRDENLPELAQSAANNVAARCLDALVQSFICNKNLVAAMIDPGNQARNLFGELGACLRSVEESVTSKSGTVDATILLKLLKIWDLIKDYDGELPYSRGNRAFHQLETCFSRLKAAILVAERRSNADVNPADPSPILVTHRENGTGPTPEPEENPPAGDSPTPSSCDRRRPDETS
ncbi:hypothetical protein FRC01_006432, partial [Tulasnella sp. 417]